VTEQCQTCRLWRRLTEDSGACHALPAAPVLYDPGLPASLPPPGGWRVAWPVTSALDTCGDWSPLPVRPPPPSRPVVALVGSSRFKRLFHETAERLEKAGKPVLMMGFFQHADGVAVSDAEREVLRGVDRHRLDLATEVGVVSEGGYVGEDTAREVRYALDTGRPVWWLEEAALWNFQALSSEGGRSR
jgi:hypothetical protein